MSCGHCKAAVTRAVSALKGVSSVEVDLEKKTVAVYYDEGGVSGGLVKLSASSTKKSKKNAYFLAFFINRSIVLIL